MRPGGSHCPPDLRAGHPAGRARAPQLSPPAACHGAVALPEEDFVTEAARGAALKRHGGAREGDLGRIVGTDGAS